MSGIAAARPTPASARAQRAARPPKPTKVVVARATPTTPRRFRAALARAYKQVIGKPPSVAELDILTAHVTHETGHGRRMFNFNFGGIQGKSPAGRTARYRTTEYFDGVKTPTTGGFRAYGSLHEGAVDYMRTMKARYGSALEQAAQGDVEGFTRALKSRRYFTAPLEGYARSLNRLVADMPDALRAVGADDGVAVLPGAPPMSGGSDGVATMPLLTHDALRAVHDTTRELWREGADPAPTHKMIEEASRTPGTRRSDL